MGREGIPGRGTSMSKDTEAENPVWKQEQAVLKEHSVMSSGCLGWGKGGGKGSCGEP